ncbi:MAG: RHS repeat-associated core domain-containing protein [Terracidiphilus sp.]
MIDTATAVSGAVTSYSYGTGSCQDAFPVTVSEPLSLSRSMTWNCNGGVMTSVTDENENTSSTGYIDANFWRPTSTTDQAGNVTTITYPLVNNAMVATESSLPIVSGTAVYDVRTTTDNLGRPMYTQQEQGPGDTNYDTAETDYNNDGLPYRFTMPYTQSASPSSGDSSAPAVTETFDALGRVLTATDADGGEVQYTYTNNDVVQVVSGSQIFTKEFQYDGLGRLTAVCEVAPYQSGAGSCGMGVSETGFLTNYTYDALGHLFTVTESAQTNGSPQSRSFKYDLLGRMTYEKNPETGQTWYTWDSWSDCPAAPSSPGNLVGKSNYVENATCYAYDLLNRVTQAMTTNGTGACRYYVYDNATPPSGITFTNGKTHLIEAYTATTCNGKTSLQTDEWFSYGPRGAMTDVYELTPNSGGYFHTTATYYPNFALESIGGIPQTPTINYGANGNGLDGEGRYTQITDSSGNTPMQSATYSTSSLSSVLGSLSNITFGSGDSEGFIFDPNTDRMTQFQSTVGGQTDTGALGWDISGTLTSLNITDNIPGTTDTQSCAYAYDDIARIKSASCGSLGSQTYTYDAFGNIFKTANGLGVSFLPSSYTGNQPAGYSFDGLGNMLTDNLNNSFTWDIYGDLLSATSGGSTVNVTYDGLGRMAEIHSTETGYNQFVYAPSMQEPVATTLGQSLGWAYVPLVGGTQVAYEAPNEGIVYYRHSDWLGSSRLSSDAYQSTYSGTAYAPFGETYGTYNGGDTFFTGQDQYTAAGLYDFPFRRLSASQGRWLSPDPAGAAAVDPTTPQSWNRYAYVLNNPLGLIDPFGLECEDEFYQFYYPGEDGDDGEYGDPEFCNERSAQQGGNVFGPGGGGANSNACTQPILNAVNNYAGTNFTSADIQSPGPFNNGNTTNLILASNSLSAAQFNAIQTGRYPLGPWTWLTGYGPTLHITGLTAFDPAPATFSNSNIGGALSVILTAHIDYAFSYNPLGLIIHGIDVLLTKLGFTVHKKC